MRHDEAAGLLSALAAGTLAAAERSGVEAHLAGCASCGRVLEDWRRLALVVGRTESASVPASRMALARVRGQVRSSRGAGGLGFVGFLAELLMAQPSIIRWQIW